MKITFLVPPVLVGEQAAERSSGCTHVVYATPNIYELQVAACARDAGHEVHYMDCVNHKIQWNDFMERSKLDPSDCYAIWTVNLSIDNDIEAIRRLHAQMPNIWTILMGPGASYFSQKCLIDEHTIIIHGEVEQTFVELAASIDKDWKGITGISYLDQGKEKRTGMRPLMKDLDSLPLPAIDLVSDFEYRNPKLKLTPYITLQTSRNCPFHCIYCVPSSQTFSREIEHRRYYNRKPPIAFRSVEKVAEDLKQLHQLGFKAIGFVDDNFIWNEERTKGLCQALKDNDMKWSCQARVDAITPAIAQMLHESGCLCVDLGVESFNDDILKFVHKGITSEQIYQAIHTLQDYQVPVKVNVLIGTSPLETKQTIRDTIKKAKRLKADQLMINIVSPFPGTEFYTMAIKNGWIENNEYHPTDVQRNSILNYPHLSSRDMEKLLFWSNISYYFAPRFIWTQLRRFHTWKDFAHALKTLKIKLWG